MKQEFNIFIGINWIDTVFFEGTFITAEKVKQNLIKKDRYSKIIKVEEWLDGRELNYEIDKQDTYGRDYTIRGMAITPSENTVVIRTPQETNEEEKELIIEDIEQNKIEPADEIFYRFICGKEKETK